MRRLAPSRLLALSLALISSGAALAASPEWETPVISHKTDKPFFDASKLHTVVLGPAPVEGSLTDRDDVAGVMVRQKVDAARRQQAEQDAKFLYDRFAEAFGRPIQRDSVPLLVNLLNRAEKQVSGPAFAAKPLYARLRPHQRLALENVCGRSSGSQPDPDSQQRTSYPSGHSAYGWTAALVLARVAPDRAPVLLQRAAEYGESRVICGMHFPSDIEAGRQLATAVVAQLDQLPEFQQALAAVKAELAAAR